MPKVSIQLYYSSYDELDDKLLKTQRHEYMTLFFEDNIINKVF